MTRSLAAWVSVLALCAPLAGALGGCSGSKGGPTISTPPRTTIEPAGSAVVSSEILAREPIANTASVKHILISWRELGESFGGRIDPRAAKRSKADAEAAVRALLKQIAEGASFEDLMKASSEDTGSAMSGREFVVTPDAQLVIEFRQLSLRLNVGEVGVIESEFGFHIIKRFS